MSRGERGVERDARDDVIDLISSISDKLMISDSTNKVINNFRHCALALFYV